MSLSHPRIVLRLARLMPLAGIAGLVAAAPVQARQGDRQPAAEQAVLMSLKPVWAERMFVTGTKRFELRKNRPGWHEGTQVLIYASTDDGKQQPRRVAKRALVGSFVTGKIYEGSPLELWLTLGAAADGVEGYFRDVERGYAIEVTDPRRLARPVPLEELRERAPGFVPPQSLQYLRPGEATLWQALEESRRGSGPEPQPARVRGPLAADDPRIEGAPPRRAAANAQPLFVYHPDVVFARQGGALRTTAHTKPREVHDALLAEGLAAAAQILRPGRLSVEDLLRAHSARYVQAVLTGEGRLAMTQGFFGGWAPEVARHALASAAGSYEAARLALDRGTIVGHLASGSHHASLHMGDGFGTFNGPVVAAKKLQAEGRARRVLIVDGDLHFGSGTSQLTLGDPSLAYYAVYGVPTGSVRETTTNVARPVPRGASPEEYLATFASGLEELVDRFQPEVILYNAGADPYHSDPVNRAANLQAGRRTLFLRDTFLFALARSRGIPVAWELGGGYTPDRRRLVELHLNTARAAKEVLAQVRPGTALRRVAGMDAMTWSVQHGAPTFPRWQVGQARAQELLGPGPEAVPEERLVKLVRGRTRGLTPRPGEIAERQLEEAMGELFGGPPRPRRAPAEAQVEQVGDGDFCPLPERPAPAPRRAPAKPR
ncbi:MAG: hypothetical protein IT371_30075 [Deltaproteobacteria bacterium]|nr:hypothetical protein [Deltaproteobacteria bacterium]